MSFDEGRRFERERFFHLVEGIESKALRHMFFGERQAAKIPDVPEDTPTRELRSAMVVGEARAAAMVAADPYTKAGLFESVTVRAWNLVIGTGLSAAKP